MIRRSLRGSASIGQLIAGLLALPLSALPFLAYGTMTPEGRLVRDRLMVRLNPPTLPVLTGAQLNAIRENPPRYEGGVVALAYHGIGSSSDGEGGFVVSPKRFGEHLAYLRAAGVNAVTASDVGAALTGGRPLPPNAVMISFDDGRTDAMMFADPLLADAGMAATMFVIADSAAKPGLYYASWDKIESYARSGRWDIQSHTAASHRDQEAEGGEDLPMLTSLARGESLDEYRARISDDLERASDAIEAHVGRSPVALAYPFGAYGGDDRTNDPAIYEILREEVAREYVVAFHQDDQETVPLLTPDSDLLGLRRVEVGNWTGAQLLKRIAIAAAGGRALPMPVEEEQEIPLLDVPALPVAPAPPATVTSPNLPVVPGGPVVNIGATPAPSGGAPAPAPAPPGGSAPSTTVAPPAPATTLPPVTAPPTTRPPSSPPTTRPPTTVAPPTTGPPTTVAPCNRPGNGQGPDRCPPGRNR